MDEEMQVTVEEDDERGNITVEEDDERGNITVEEDDERGNITVEEDDERGNITVEEDDERGNITVEEDDERGNITVEEDDERGNITVEEDDERGNITVEEDDERGNITVEEDDERGNITVEEDDERGNITVEEDDERGNITVEEDDERGRITVEEDEEYGIALPTMQQPALYRRRLRDCYRTVSLCLRLIHQAVRENRWERAAELLTSYLQILVTQNTDQYKDAPEIIWRLGSEILLNHPKSTSEDVNAFHEVMKNIGVNNYLLISLEQVFHLLCVGDMDEAQRVLSVAESWAFGCHSMKRMKLQKLIQAYRAVLNYLSWVDKESAVTQHAQDFSSQCSTVQAMGTYYRLATGTFKEMLQFPGVWDPFLLNYVDLLESSGERKKAEKVLTDYAYNAKNPTNPNAHAYLYEFMLRNGAPKEKLMEVLRILYTITPSHKLMREYSALLKKSESEEDQNLALRVLFDLLDFSGWKKDVKSWRSLMKLLKKAFLHNHKSWISEAWQPRKSWWPLYHFTKFDAKKDLKKCPKLAMKKAFVAGMLQGPGCIYFTFICGSKKCDPRSLDRMKTFIKEHKCKEI